MSGGVTILPCRKRVRVVAAGEVIADSTETLLVLGRGAFPIYFFPAADVRPSLPPDVVSTRDDVPELAGRLAFVWDKVRFLEEEEELVGHVRDPFHRVDTRRSARRVRIVLDGQTVADSRCAVFLFETGIRTRYYVPRDDIAMRLLEPSPTRTACPYKGWASYWSATVAGRRFDDVAWCYEDPLPESREIAGLLAFYDEKVDAVLVDAR
jgi:uncharacterized protein (DUF427 family)